MAGLELHEACSMGDYDLLEEYLKSGKYDVNLKDVEFKNMTPLHWAATKGQGDCVRMLLEHGANGTARMQSGWTPAHCAAELGKIHALRALVNAGVSIKKKDAYGDTPRRRAEVYGHWECVKYLMQAEKEDEERRANSGNPDEPESEDEWNDES